MDNDDLIFTPEEAEALGFDVENDPQLNGICDEIEANPDRFIDKEHAHGFVIALERHFKRVSDLLSAAGFTPWHDQETIEQRVKRMIETYKLAISETHISNWKALELGDAFVCWGCRQTVSYKNGYNETGCGQCCNRCADKGALTAALNYIPEP